MSAICGIIHFDGKPVDKADLAIMAESSPHRGPDGVSFHVDGNAGFAHLAFHVTPESVYGEQPLNSENGRFTLVADVRLDNRDELIRKLGEDTARKKPSQLTDSELLMAAFVRWGEQCLDHLLGDFVFAVWNRDKQELFLGRDALGGYSVTWHQSGQTLLFASETTAILDLPFVTPVIEQINVAKVLAYQPRGAEETFFKDIYFLPAAHYLKATASGISVSKYWDINPGYRVEYRDESEYPEHFLELVEQAVLCRLRSTRPVGIALSGGHDSTLLAAAAARQLPASGLSQKSLKSFSYVFDRHAESDERMYIEAVVKRYDIEADYVVADDMWTFRDLENKPVQRDYLWTNCYTQLPLSMAAAAQRAGCGVLIDGQFGDAICSGRTLFAADLLQRGQLFRLFSILRKHGDELNWREELIEKGIRPLLPRWLRQAYRRLKPVPLKPFVSGLHPDWVQRLQNASRANRAFGVMDELSPSKKQRYGYLLNPSWANGFAAVRAPFYNRFGLERVSPFFDRRIVEYVMAIPSEQVAHPGRYRRLQTDAMKRVLPPLVYQRKKDTLYTGLLQEGLLLHEKHRVDNLLREPLLTRQGWIEEDWLSAQKQAGDDWEADGFPFAMCLHAELWLRAVEEMPDSKRSWAQPFYYRP